MLFAGPVAWLGRWLRCLVVLVGGLALVLAMMAFTRIPFDAHRWLGTAAGECSGIVDRIVVLGGSGMPSGPELLRLHRAAQLAAEFQAAPVVIVHPGEPVVLAEMVGELVLRGVAEERITALNEGDNTREQALVLARAERSRAGRMAVITAPENMYRTIRCFRRAGLSGACAEPAWDHAMYHDFGYAHKAVGGKTYVPDVSRNLSLRYTFWNYLKLEITCLREYVAIGYYRLNGWI